MTHRPTLFLHVGAPKCASSTLQAAFALFRDGAMTFPHELADAISWQAGAHWVDKKPNDADPVAAAAAWGERDCILSHESFLNNFDKVFPPICKLFPEHHVRVLIIERPIDEMAQSAIAQYVRTCMKVPSARTRLDAIRAMGMPAYTDALRLAHNQNCYEWSMAADSCCQGLLKDLEAHVVDWLGTPDIAEHISQIGTRNARLSPATVDAMLERLDSFTGTPEEWRDMAEQLERDHATP